MPRGGMATFGSVGAPPSQICFVARLYRQPVEVRPSPGILVCEIEAEPQCAVRLAASRQIMQNTLRFLQRQDLHNAMVAKSLPWSVCHPLVQQPHIGRQLGPISISSVSRSRAPRAYRPCVGQLAEASILFRMAMSPSSATSPLRGTSTIQESSARRRRRLMQPYQGYHRGPQHNKGTDASSCLSPDQLTKRLPHGHVRDTADLGKSLRSDGEPAARRRVPRPLARPYARTLGPPPTSPPSARARPMQPGDLLRNGHLRRLSRLFSHPGYSCLVVHVPNIVVEVAHVGGVMEPPLLCLSTTDPCRP